MSRKRDQNDCILCFNPLADESKNVCNFTNKFLVFLSRHLKMHWKNNWLDTTTDQFMVCGDCLKLVESFCELYSQLECVQLQLNWKVQRIFETMVHAEQVPVSSLRNGNDNGRKRNIDDDSDKLRRNLIKHWKKLLTSVKPRVELRKINEEPTDAEAHDKKVSVQRLTFDVNDLLTTSPTSDLNLNDHEVVNNPELNLYPVENNGPLQFQSTLTSTSGGTGQEELQSNRWTMMIAESQVVEAVPKKLSQEFNCPYCHRAYSQSKNLRFHLRKAHKNYFSKPVQKKVSNSTKKHIQEVSKVFADVRILDQTQMVFDVLPTTSYSHFQPEPEDLFMDDNVDEETEMKVPLEHLPNKIEIIDGFNDNHVTVDALNNDEMCERVGVINNNPEQSQVEYVLAERTPPSSSSSSSSKRTKSQARKVIPKPKQRFECHICGKVLNRSNNLRFHMREIHKTISNFEGAYQCQICLEKFSHPSHLKRHSKMHQNPNTNGFKCEHCPIVFETKYKLCMHTYNVHKKPKQQVIPRTWRIVCDKEGCGRNFATYRNLVIHQAKSHLVKPEGPSSQTEVLFECSSVEIDQDQTIPNLHSEFAMD